MIEKDFSQITKEHNDSMLLTKMTVNSIRVIQKQIKVSNEEIQEMINYFAKLEYYHICSLLKEELQ